MIVMEYSIQKLENSVVEIAIKVGKDKWNECISEAYKKTKGQYKVQGFRPGKVPFDVIVNRYGIEAFYEDALDYGINKYYREIIEKDKLDVVSSPEVDVHNVDEEGFNVVLKVEVYPTIEVEGYKGLSFKKIKSKYNKKMLDEELKRIQQKYTTWKEVDRASQNGDKLTLDYSGEVDGVKFDGGTAENQQLELGSNTFIPGFEDQLIGTKKGEEIDVKVKFPKDYHAKELADKNAIFKCKVHVITEKVVPELNDEFAKDMGEFETLDEYKKHLEKELKSHAEQEAKYEEEDEMIKAIVANNEFEIPQGLIDEESDRHINEIAARYKSMGISLDDFLKYSGKTMEDFYNDFAEQSKNTVKTRVVLEAIIAKEGLTVAKEEFDKELEEIAKQSQKDVEEFKKNFDQQLFAGIMNKILIEKLITFLRTSNKFE